MYKIIARNDLRTYKLFIPFCNISDFICKYEIICVYITIMYKYFAQPYYLIVKTEKKIQKIYDKPQKNVYHKKKNCKNMILKR